jgi:hypothetical protein
MVQPPLQLAPLLGRLPLIGLFLRQLLTSGSPSHCLRVRQIAHERQMNGTATVDSESFS